MMWRVSCTFSNLTSYTFALQLSYIYEHKRDSTLHSKSDVNFLYTLSEDLAPALSANLHQHLLWWSTWDRNLDYLEQVWGKTRQCTSEQLLLTACMILRDYDISCARLWDIHSLSHEANIIFFFCCVGINTKRLQICLCSLKGVNSFYFLLLVEVSFSAASLHPCISCILHWQSDLLCI